MPCLNTLTGLTEDALTRAVGITMQPAISVVEEDPSSSKKRTSGFKKSLVRRDMKVDVEVQTLICCVTGLVLPSANVTAAHIFPVRAKQYLFGFCPDLQSINDVRNGLLWCEVVESAFETGSIMFDWNEGTKVLTPYVLDYNILGIDFLEASHYLNDLMKSQGMQIAPVADRGSSKKFDNGKNSINGKKDKRKSKRYSDISSTMDTHTKQNASKIFTECESGTTESETGTNWWEVREVHRDIVRQVHDQLPKHQYGNVFKGACIENVTQAYRSKTFDSINRVPIQLNTNVSLCSDAFLARAVIAFHSAQSRQVLPKDFKYDWKENPLELVLRTGLACRTYSNVSPAFCISPCYSGYITPSDYCNSGYNTASDSDTQDSCTQDSCNASYNYDALDSYDASDNDHASDNDDADNDDGALDNGDVLGNYVLDRFLCDLPSKEVNVLGDVSLWYDEVEEV